MVAAVATYVLLVIRTGRLRSAAAVVIAAVTFSGCSSGAIPQASTSPPGTAACARPLPHSAGQSSQSISFESVTRTYQLYVPTSYDGRRRVPVVFEFHSYGSNASQQILYGNFEPLADRHDFLVVAPDGQGSPRQWGLVGGLVPGGQDDVVFTLALLSHLEHQLCVDSGRVYATGMSDGGVMTSVLACRAPRQFAAFATVAGNLYGIGCTTSSPPVPMLMFHGTADPTIPYAGGRVTCCGNPTFPSVASVTASWASHDHCNPSPTTSSPSADVKLTSYSACAPGSTVELYTLVGDGHTWPGSSFPLPVLGATSTELNASATIWSFFAAHRI